MTTHGPRHSPLTGLLLVLAAHSTTPLWADAGQPLPLPSSAPAEATKAAAAEAEAPPVEPPPALLLPATLGELQVPRLVPKRSGLDLPLWVERARTGSVGEGIHLATKPIPLFRYGEADPAGRPERLRARFIGACLLAARLAAEDEVEVRFRIPLPD